MQRILNNPDNIVDEMLEGFIRAHSDIVETTENPRAIKSKSLLREESLLSLEEDPAISLPLSDFAGKACVTA